MKNKKYEVRTTIVGGRKIRYRVPKNLIESGAIAPRGARMAGVEPGKGILPDIPDVPAVVKPLGSDG